MDVLSALNEKLLYQPFTDDTNESSLLEKYNQLARLYASLENSLAVLSDLKSDRSYIYHGAVSEALDISERKQKEHIDSIWEEDILDRIHPDDLLGKHLMELHFFQLLKYKPVEERSDYQVISNLRMRDRTGNYIRVKHRMFYVCSCPAGNLWLALCLYNHAYEKADPGYMKGFIFNSYTGDIIEPDKQKEATLLSAREKEILLLIQQGNRSKDIAEILSISKNTVSRHRQNILDKLRVKNSFEACRIAGLMGLI